MKVAIASGKGGTGKTTVSAALISVWNRPVTAVDLDVEAPNLHLFLKPRIVGYEKADIEVPVADESKCTHCRACADLCQFKAISVLGNVLLIFPEMCHGCGGCLAVCPEKALSPGRRELGEIRWGNAGRAGFLMGVSRIGEAMSPPLMRAVKSRLQFLLQAQPADVVIDAPPGVSCPAVNAVMDADVIVLVT
jgi:MinD superfamily P-loop ATPase